MPRQQFAAQVQSLAISVVGGRGRRRTVKARGCQILENRLKAGFGKHLPNAVPYAKGTFQSGLIVLVMLLHKKN